MRLLLLALLFLTSPGYARAGESIAPSNAVPIALEEAINVALSNNLSLISLEYSLASSEVALQSQLNQFRINIRPEIGSTRSEDNRTDLARLRVTKDTGIGTSLSALAGTSKTTPDDDESPYYRTTVALEIHQPLLRNVGTLTNLEGVRDARRGVLNSRREIALKQTDLIVDVVEAHESLLSLQRQIDYQTQTLERLIRFLKLTSAREKQGRSTRVDTMRADLRLGNARLRMASLTDRLLSERTTFAELLGMDPGTLYTAQPSELMVITPPDPEEAAAIALSNRLDYAQILDAHLDAERGISIARQNLLPNLSLIARYELAGEDEEHSETLKMEDDVWFIGFQLASDFPQRDEKASFAEAQIALGRSELRIDTVKLAIKKQVRQAISTYKRILVEKELAEKNYDVAHKRTRLARKLFQMGKGDSFSVSEAEDELLAAEQQLLSSQSDASIASYKLKRVTGSLVEYPEELKPREMSK